LFGPVVMAFRSQGANPATAIDFANLAGNFTPITGAPLNFRLAGAPSVLMRPFYAFREGERYFLYLDPSAAYVRAGFENVRFSPDWTSAGSMKITTKVGATAAFDFEGNGIRCLCSKFDDAGKMEIRIDGQVVEVVDLYDPTRGIPANWERRGLPPGKHTITITLIEEKNPSSKDRYLNISGFDILASP